MEKFLDELYRKRKEILKGILIYYFILIVCGLLFTKTTRGEFLRLFGESFLFNLVSSIVMYGFYGIGIKVNKTNRLFSFFSLFFAVILLLSTILGVFDFIMTGKLSEMQVGAPMLLYALIEVQRFAMDESEIMPKKDDFYEKK